MESEYFDTERSAAAAAAGRHRDIVGGVWDEMGALQFQFLKSRGLRPEHRLLDVGCGALRGGVRFVPYLEPGHYYGVDISRALLDSGLAEVAAAGAAERLPATNLHATSLFEFPFDQAFDFAIAQSVFTHLGFNWIRRCLEQVCDVMVDGGEFYATFFERPGNAPARTEQRHEPGGKRSHDIADPYHYSLDDLRYAARDLPFDVEYIGDWKHPRSQMMVVFRKRKANAPPAEAEDQRRLSIGEAAGLPAGSHHYRAYVGPPNRFDFMSATQFSLLFTLGLRDHHRVLDFGCGSLRLGRLLIPFLRPGGYFGVEPNAWLIDDALANETGRDVVAIKRPRFSHNSDFDCGVFGEKFEFIIAQSIVTHCGPDLFQKAMDGFASVLADDGVVALSYWNTPKPLAQRPADGWHYPSSVKYLEAEVDAFTRKAGLVGMAIPWHHPGASWYLAARRPERLPSEQELAFLRGAVLHDPQFAASRLP